MSESAFGVDHGDFSKAMSNINPMKAFKPKPVKPAQAAWKPTAAKSTSMKNPFAQALSKPAQPLMASTNAQTSMAAGKPPMKPKLPGQK